MFNTYIVRPLTPKQLSNLGRSENTPVNSDEIEMIDRSTDCQGGPLARSPKTNIATCT